jgi:outer membrane assembly lipoprotein YfiO
VNRFLRQTLLVATCLVAGTFTTACHREFDPKRYPNSEDLFNAGMREFNAHHWGNAIKAFQQLTNDLPARNPYLPLSYYYLGLAQEHDGDNLLAAQSLSRLEQFPEDTLAPIAIFQSGMAYSKMWKKPELDPQYGKSAQERFQTLIALYPESPYVARADADLARLDNLFAAKDYSIAHQYRRRRAYDSAIIYYKDVIRLHPTAPITRKASLELYDTYKTIKYDDDARDLCTPMLKSYPNDHEVTSRCGSASSAAASTPHT